MKNKVVAIVGATGAVGREFIGCIESRGIPLKSLKLLASARSAGQKQGFRGQELTIDELKDDSFNGVDIALFSAGSGISKQYGPIAVKAGAVVVDNSSAFRMDPAVPLVVPEINARRIADHKGIIANPNCSAITALVPLWPIHQQNRIKRVIISTYQAASGAGAAAMQELEDGTRAFLDGKPFTPKVMPHPYAFNVFSHNTAIDPETGYNDEETKVIKETKKIFEDEQIRVGVTCIRVPVLRAHSESITFECERPITEDEVRAILSKAPGVKIIDDRVKNYFPMPLDASGQGDILVGRIRKDVSDPSGHSIAMFVAGDQLLKGAALNAVQIAELLLTHSSFGAVIFDCDGVLVDSEVLIHAIELEALAECGMHYESGPFKARFLGMSLPDYYAALDADAMERLGRAIQHELQPKMKARIRTVFDEQLAAVPGARDAVTAVRLPRAVASSSGVEALDYKLKKTGLWDDFAPHIYSSEHVARAKPAPDLFLHAAQELGVAPADCLVIEDSVNGVRAGLAAGMTVWGFCGGGHMDDAVRASVTAAGAHRVVGDWAEAQGLFAAL